MISLRLIKRGNGKTKWAKKGFATRHKSLQAKMVCLVCRMFDEFYEPFGTFRILILDSIA